MDFPTGALASNAAVSRFLRPAPRPTVARFVGSEHEKLGNTTDELHNYTIQEGGFFGDVFQGTGFYVAACQGNDATNADRQCAQQNGITGQTMCGMDYAGLCANVCGGTWAVKG